MEEFITSYLYPQIKMSVFSNNYDSLYSGTYTKVPEEYSALIPVPVAASLLGMWVSIPPG